MLWNKKEDDKDSLPELPPIKPRLAIAPAQQSTQHLGPKDEFEPEKNALPSFPNSAINQGFSQAAIKDAVGTEETKEESKLPKLPEEPEAKEMEEWHPELPRIVGEPIHTPITHEIHEEEIEES